LEQWWAWALAAALLQVLVPYAARFTPRAFEIGLDAPVLAFTLGVSVLVGLASGTLPLLSVTRDLASGLRTRGDARAGGRQARPCRARARGCAGGGVRGASCGCRAVGAQHDRAQSHRRRVQARAGAEPARSRRAANGIADLRTVSRSSTVLVAATREQPGVTSVALSAAVPLGEGGRMSHGILIDGRPIAPGDAAPQAEMQVVSGNYFSTIGVPLMKGRTFDDHDRLETEEVTVISRSLAERYWPNADPIGARISGDGGDSWIRIVGVVGDVRDHALDEDPIAVFYLSYAQTPGGGSLLLRSNVEPAVLARRVTAAIHGIDPTCPLTQFGH
jgi:hypothetical protein